MALNLFIAYPRSEVECQIPLW